MSEFYLRPVVRVEADNQGAAVDKFLKVMEENDMHVRGWT